MLVKIHESYRKVVAICDAKLLGKKFEEGQMQLEIKEQFYGGEKKTEAEVLRIIRDLSAEDATFNIVGEKAIRTALKAGIIESSGVIKIDGIPHALVLL